ncbi:MAG: hypothetical protein LBT92_00225 [Rickettsiales bacterium]|jgi:hypothetical protein|nr:hypothetical protein [Rickettsiales bacterium]
MKKILLIFLACAAAAPLASLAAKKPARGARTSGTKRPAAARSGGTARAKAKARTGGTDRAEKADAAKEQEPAAETEQGADKDQALAEAEAAPDAAALAKAAADLMAEKQKKTLEEKADLEMEMKILEAQEAAVKARLIAETGTNRDVELSKAKIKAAIAEAHVNGKARASIMTGCKLNPVKIMGILEKSCSGKMGDEAEHTVEELETEMIRLNTPELLFLK